MVGLMAEPWRCTSCGWTSIKQVENCADCGSADITNLPKPPPRPRPKAPPPPPPDRTVDITKVADEDEPRFVLSDMKEFERALGGGLVIGAKVLLTGDPGIGKSTLLLKLAAAVTRAFPKSPCSSLYASGEERAGRIGARAKRLGESVKGLRVIDGTSLNDVRAAVLAHRPKLLILDSVSAFKDDFANAGGYAGSVGQIRSILSTVCEFCDPLDVTVILIVHVTKDSIAGGPKALEHMVDTFMHFEGDRMSPIRILNVLKNRHGPPGEQVVYEMVGSGLREVADPEDQLLVERARAEPGAVIFPSAELARVTLIEIEAMLSGSEERDKEGNPIERPAKLSSARCLSSERVQTIMVLMTELGLPLSSKLVSIEANTLSGAALTEGAADIAIAMAIASRAKNIVLPDDCVVLGAMSVTGRVKAVPRCLGRLEEAMKRGFRRAVIPIENARREEVPPGMLIDGIESARDIEAWLTRAGLSRMDALSAMRDKSASNVGRSLS